MRTSHSDRPSPTAGTPQPLQGVRVLEIAGPFGSYTGRLFAGVGADVLLVEPPSGAHTRRQDPFIHDIPGPERSLTHAYLHAGKRGITLDLEKGDGRSILSLLVDHADVLIESGKPGRMDALGLGYSVLAGRRPSLVYTSITPFGQVGPYSGFEATDTVILAMGGLLYLGGYADSEPVRVHGDQAILAADQYAAVATMLSLLDAEETGRGRLVDVAAQECVAMALENAAQWYDLEGRIRRRTSAQRQSGLGIFPCEDGYVCLLARGIGHIKFWKPTIQWFIDEGAVGAERLLAPEWFTVEWAEMEKAKEIFAEVFYSFARFRSKAQLYKASLARDIPLCPVSTPADVVESSQLKYRRFFSSVQHPIFGTTMVMPGAPFLMSETPWQLRGPAPTLGQHNQEVLGDLGFDGDDLVHLRAAEVI